MQAVSRFEDELYTAVDQHGHQAVGLKVVDVVFARVGVKFCPEEGRLHTVEVNHLSPEVVNLTAQGGLHILSRLNDQQGQCEENK